MRMTVHLERRRWKIKVDSKRQRMKITVQSENKNNGPLRVAEHGSFKMGENKGVHLK